jgi:phenylalanyl-tRNA synthetase alpha chain
MNILAMQNELEQLKSDIGELLKEAQLSISRANTLNNLEQLRIEYLGKKGKLTELLKNLVRLPTDKRPEAGKILNTAKQQLTDYFQKKLQQFADAEISQQLAKEQIDITLPGRGLAISNIHPVTRVRERVETLFSSMGFEIVEGPEIEDDYHNFEALNMPSYHPARTMHDTFYLKETGLLLRTHTSSVQIRVMEKNKPPLRVITPGRVYRCDSDQTHTPMFHQVEGLLIDDKTTFSHLKGMLADFLQNFFERKFKLRFRPSYFPYTEPSAEVDIECICGGSGCRVCKYTGWLEVLGCGMVHPNVLEKVGIDSEIYTGFAFGVGLDRLAMLRYGINDLRLFFENDLRFLEQF